MKKTFISGPVSGIEYEYACGHFVEAENYLSEKGRNTVNPTRLCGQSLNFVQWMKVSIPALLQCDSIYMLKGWKKSPEAKLEHFIALKLGFEIILEK